MAGNFDIYNIYDTCGNDQVSREDVYQRLHEAKVVNTSGSQVYSIHPQLSNLGGALNDYTCGMLKTRSLLNMTQLMSACVQVP